ncbi:Mu transposase C-terminal domain-containing protein [Pseudomonas sp. RA_35y_Pfl2_P32]|uniref:Mu transposase C-terminal domain-containing protein n=1 Tax=Pseudomonas sp. RA_35y_Pfl2_P32 TaxID=3088705 RepID=UPI0030D87EF8
MVDLSKNDILEALTEPHLLKGMVRVLWIDKRSDQIVLITIERTPKRPWVMRLSELKSWLISGDIKTVSIATPTYMMKVEEDLSDKEKAFRDNNWARIQALVDTDPPDDIFQPNAMGQMVKAQSLRLETPKKTIYRLLYRYWMGGQVRNALLADRVNAGAPGKPRQYREGQKPGRLALFQGVKASVQSKVLTEADKGCIKIGFALFAKGTVGTIADAYVKMLRRFYKVKAMHNDENDDTPLLPAGELPTAKQFAYWGHKAFDDIAVLRGRTGERNWQKDHRPLTGTVREGLRGPGHLFEIDATIADVYLVSRYNRNWIIGRPVVYVVIDTFSGMIVGLFVGLEGPSWNGARQALYNAFTSKVDFCAANGVEIEAADWPCHHLPHEVFADRGEMLSVAAEGLATGLRINLGIAPPYRPDWKAIVESSFKVLNTTTQIHWIAGAVRSRVRERGERDNRLDATLNLEEFTKIVIEGVLHYNRHNRQPDRLTKEMITDQVEPTPLDIWNWALRNDRIEANNQSEELIYLHLLPRDNGSVQKGGVKFKGMFYVCDWAIEQNWFARARHRGVSSITCWYDPNCTEHIWLQGPDRHFIRCDLRNSEERYRGVRFEEVIDMLAIVKQESPEKKYSKLASRVALDATISGVVANAAKEKKSTLEPGSKAEKLGNIRNNRSHERMQERSESYVPENLRAANTSQGDLAAKEGTGSADDYAGSRGGEVIDLLSRLRPGGGK